MSSTTRELITGALRLINVVQANETPSPDDMNIALSAFDAMIDSWANDKLMVYSIKPYLFNTVGGQQDYFLGPGNPVQILDPTSLTTGLGYVDGIYSNVPLTGSATGSGALATVIVAGGVVTSVSIPPSNQTPGNGGTGYVVGDVLTASNSNLGGSGIGFSITVLTVGPGDWNITRPLVIEQAFVVWSSGAQTVDLPVALLNDSQFASIAVKETPSSFPFAMYDNGNFPIKTVSVWPVPTVSTPMRLWLREPLLDMANLDSVIVYPPGYERAFRFNLAVELAPEFGKAVAQSVSATALSSRLAIARLNATPQYSIGDGGLNAQRSPFNYITGGFLPLTRF